MSPDRSGVFDTLLALARRSLGGRAGGGRQYVSWIHEDDFTRAVRRLIDPDDLSGAINLAAPARCPTPTSCASCARRRARFWLPAAGWMLAVGAFFLRTETELLLKSRRVVPARLLASGFAFDFPAWPDAARGLCRRWREERRR
jgi:NAD dependent epimerase/dehydratase family enzyme